MRRIWDHIRRQPPGPPPYVLEGYSQRFEQERRTRRFFSACGFEWRGTPTWWVQPVWIVGVGLVAGLALDRTASWDEKLATGAACAAVIAVSIAWHQLGTFAVGKLAGAPFKAVVLTATLAYQIYEEPPQPSNVHLLRALAGPASNLVLGVLALLALIAWPHSSVLRFAAALNLLFTAVAMAPIPTMDGGVVVRELRAWTRRDSLLGRGVSVDLEAAPLDTAHIREGRDDPKC
jgi:hypothetical protein